MDSALHHYRVERRRGREISSFLPALMPGCELCPVGARLEARVRPRPVRCLGGIVTSHPRGPVNPRQNSRRSSARRCGAFLGES